MGLWLVPAALPRTLQTAVALALLGALDEQIIDLSYRYNHQLLELAPQPWPVRWLWRGGGGCGSVNGINTPPCASALFTSRNRLMPTQSITARDRAHAIKTWPVADRSVVVGEVG